MSADNKSTVIERDLGIVREDAELRLLMGRLQGIADPTRARILNLLAAGELCVCDVVEILGLPQPTVSRHLATLREQGWVTFRRVGRFSHYGLAEPEEGLAGDLGGLTEHLAELVQRLDELPGLEAERRRAAASAARRSQEPC